jgi:hypothetical protein
MSFNLLKFGINIKKPKIDNNKDKEVESTQLVKPMFPNCIMEKKTILKIKKKIEDLKNSDDIEKLKERKLKILLDKLNTAKQDLFEKLSINTQNDTIEPLCSFKEIQK